MGLTEEENFWVETAHSKDNEILQQTAAIRSSTGDSY